MDKENFSGYYECHYKPMLEDLCQNENLTEKERRLISFLKEDIEELFVEKEED